MRTRVIPSLTLRDRGVVRTTRFADPKYVGDPVVALKIFNDREVDEVLILDISPTEEWRPSQLELLRDLASEAFMPMGYGGKIRSLEHMRQLFALGYEKVCVNTAAVETPELVQQAAKEFGSQSVVVSIDVRRPRFGGPVVCTHLGAKRTKIDPVEHARRMEQAGAGELLITAIDRDGTMAGYDVALLRSVSEAVRIPVVAMGGAGTLAHLREAVAEGGVQAVAAGSMFVYHGRHRAVLINYPERAELEQGLP